jgi:hypothetical protein
MLLTSSSIHGCLGRNHQEPLQFKIYCPIYTFVIAIYSPISQIFFFQIAIKPYLLSITLPLILQIFNIKWNLAKAFWNVEPI